MSKKPTLIVLDDYEGVLGKAKAMEDMKQLADVTILRHQISEKDNNLLKRAKIILPLRERTKIDANFLDKCPHLDLILQTGGHIYHMDLEEVTKRGIAVASGRGATQPMVVVPELTFGLILGLMRRIYPLSTQMRDHGWPDEIGQSIAGKTLGILGYGRHGKPTARIAEAFQMKVIAWNRTNQYPAMDEYGVERVCMDELLQKSDIISIHLRLSESSIGLIDKTSLKKMKRNAFLINTSRGAVINENDLIDALENGWIAGAGLDVFSEEPLVDESPLRKFDNVLLTPHIGWKVDSVLHEFMEIASKHLKSWLNHELPKDRLLNPQSNSMRTERTGGIK